MFMFHSTVALKSETSILNYITYYVWCLNYESMAKCWITKLNLQIILLPISSSWHNNKVAYVAVNGNKYHPCPQSGIWKRHANKEYASIKHLYHGTCWKIQLDTCMIYEHIDRCWYSDIRGNRVQGIRTKSLHIVGIVSSMPYADKGQRKSSTCQFHDYTFRFGAEKSTNTLATYPQKPYLSC